MLDIFSNNPGFTVTELSLSLNRIPFQPYQIGRLGLFREIRLSTTTTMIEVRGERLALVPELPRGAPPTPNVEERRSAVAFGIPHFPIRDTIYADEVQNLRAFGSTDALESVYGVVDQREEKLGRRLDLTLEFLRLGALKGIVITAVDRVTGATDKSVNLYDRFEVPQQPIIPWPIVNAGAEGGEAGAWGAGLTRLTSNLGRAMAAELSGGMYTRIHGMCGSIFFDAFAAHPERRGAFIALDSRPVLDPILGNTITFREVSITEYRGNINGVPLIAPDMCYFFPVGAPDMFVEIYAPADYMEAVNTLALPRYSKMEDMEFDKGVKLEAQMNVLPLCTTPRALFRAQAVPWTPGSDIITVAAPVVAPQTNPVSGDTTDATNRGSNGNNRPPRQAAR